MQPPTAATVNDPVGAPETPAISAPTRPKGKEAEELIRRAPVSYVWNQLGSMWQFVALFMFNIVVVRGLGNAYGVLAVALTLFNTLVYFAAFGLEDAASVFVPRTLGDAGRPAMASIVRKLLVTRVLMVGVLSVAIIPLILALGNAHSGVAGNINQTLRAGDIAPVILPLALYLSGTGMANLLGAIFTSLLRTRLTFVVNGLSQLANLAGAFAAIRLGYGVGGVLWAVGIVTWATALIYLLLLAPLGLTRRDTATPPSFAPVMRLGGTAWLTNLISGALLKQSVVWVMGFFVIADIIIGRFNLAFQLSHAAAFLLIAGLGGVGLAAMAAAYSGEDRAGLATAWRAVSKVQVLLAVPLLAFVFIHAQSIAVALYGVNNIGVGDLMQIFLVFNIAQRLGGGGSSQAALYVIGKQWLALLTQWIGLIVTVGLALALVPATGLIGGAAGALIAVGVGQAGVEFAQLILASHYLHRKYPIRFTLRVCLALIPPIALAYLWRHPGGILPIPSHIGALPIGRFSDLIVAVIVFAIVLVASLAIARPIEADDVELLAQTNPRLRPILRPFASGFRPATATPTPSAGKD